jgi:glycosyltransferase involved in cell wall biosynthesis
MTVSGPAGTPRARVLFVAHEAHDDGGMERAMAELIRRAARDYDVVVVSRKLASDLRSLVEWQRVRIPQRPRPLAFVLFFLLAGIRAARTRADIVHTLGALVPNHADIATVQFCHAGYREASRAGAPPRRPPARRLNAALGRTLGLAAERWSYGRGRVQVLAAVSKGVARELNRHYPSARVAVTPNGVDLERFRPDFRSRRELRSDEGVDPDHMVAVFVGSDWDHKGLEIAMRGLAQARASGATNLKLWVVGRGDTTRFEKEARSLGIVEDVRFFGFRRDTERFYQAADVFVFPSAYETFSLVSFEAAACGLPVVATRLNGVEELIGPDDGGLTIGRSPEAFANALLYLATNPHERQAMGNLARRRAARFTWERSTQGVLDLYSDLLEGTPEGREAA